MSKNTVVFVDIETAANESMIPFLPEPTPPGNYKKEDSIARWIAQAKIDQAARAALDLDLARITSIAVAKDADPPRGWVLETLDENRPWEEQEIVNQFWGWMDVNAQGARIIGYNIRNFDLPILLRRTWQLDIVPPTNITPLLTRASSQVIDLMELLYHNGYTSTRYRGLKDVCKMYGIPNLMPDTDGSMVSEMDADELLAYNLNDVSLMQGLAQRTKGYYWFSKEI